MSKTLTTLAIFCLLLSVSIPAFSQNSPVTRWITSFWVKPEEGKIDIHIYEDDRNICYTAVTIPNTSIQRAGSLSISCLAKK